MKSFRSGGGVARANANLAARDALAERRDARRRFDASAASSSTRRRADVPPHRPPCTDARVRRKGVFRDSWPEIWLTSPPSSPLPLVHSAGKAVSSNAYATGTDQNCGNVITDRPSTRLHAPPGGHSSFSFGQGDDAPVEPRGAGLSRQAAQDAASGAHSNVASQVFGVPSVAMSGSSNAFANGADQNCGNFITDRPTTRLHAPPGGKSQISFGGDEAPEPTYNRPDTAAAAAKEREYAGNDIFGAAPAPERRAEPEVLVVEPPAAAFVEATEREIRPMIIAELRQLCREHGLSPAGAKDTLVDRLMEAIAQGRARVMVPNRGASGVSNVGNNYGRAEGQNIGNFMTGRNSSRVLAPPGGGSSFSLGGYGSEQPPEHTVR